ncbi:MAG: GDP-mannose 4,6-dehydratase [Candidatus Omnitrophota bacterium]
MKRALITGITGFVGSHLAEFLLKQKGIKVYGIERWRSKTENIDQIKDRLILHECDIRDATSVKKVISSIRPDYIFHLAAQSFVPTSWHAPVETLTTNIIGELNIFEAVKELKLNCRIQIACSSEEYGMVYKNEVPIKETNPLRPLSPYGVSKVAQDLLGYQYHQSYGLKVIRTRAFNHTGPRRGEVFVSSNFAKQIALIEKGKQEPTIYVGNLKARRDFTDVRDVVRAYWLAVQKGQPGELYNICSGRAITISQLLNILLSLSRVKPKIKPEPQRMRPSDVEILLGDASKFRRQTGWKPQIPLKQTLKDLLDYWRERI